MTDELISSYHPRFCPFYRSGECFVFPATSGYSVDSSRGKGFIKPCIMTRSETGRPRPMKWKDCPEYQAGQMILDIRKEARERRQVV